MLQEIPQEELSAVLDLIAAEAIAKAQLGEPPIDALAIAKCLGLTVAWDDRQAGRARTATLAGAVAESPSIFLRHDPRIERQHWAVAHEIGESLAGQAFKQLGIDPREAPPQARESVANAIAARLLLPRETFAADGAACTWDLLALKARYTTASHELIARRMLDFPQNVIIAVFDQNRQTWRKSNFPTRLPKPSTAETELRRQAHELGQNVSSSGPPIVHVWPIHEPLWKREIVRVELDEFAQD